MPSKDPTTMTMQIDAIVERSEFGPMNRAGVQDDDFLIPNISEPANKQSEQAGPQADGAVKPVSQLPPVEVKADETTPDVAPATNEIPPTMASVEGFSNQAPEQLPTAWKDEAKTETQARWLDELYESAVPESNQVPAPPQKLSGGWNDNSIAPQLLRPNTDPRQFEDLPSPSVEEAKRVLENIEAKHAAPKPEQDPQLDQPIADAKPAVPEAKANEPAASPIDLSRLKAENPAAVQQPVEPSKPIEKVEEPVAEEPVATPAKEPVEDSSEASQMESVAEVLARMRASGKLDSSLLDDNGESDAVQVANKKPETSTALLQPAPEAPVAPAALIALANEPAAGGKKDESVQDYMNQLMQRLNSGPGAQDDVAIDQTATTANAVAASTPIDEVSAEVPEVMEDLTPDNPLDESEYIPNNKPREKVSTLDALRQVANQSVQSAIQHSAREKDQKTSLIYLSGSGACLFLSAVLFMLSSGLFDMAFMLAILFAVGCVAMGFMFLSINSAKELQDEETNAAKKAQPMAVKSDSAVS